MTISAEVGPNCSFLLDKDRRLSQSVLWDYQRRFFSSWGVNAWS
jgi:hypothetical protein